jgi:glutamate 5-kinase
MKTRQDIPDARRWVVKVGSALVTNEGQGLDDGFIRHLVDQIAVLCEKGIDVVLVSSGAVAEGMARLGWFRRPGALHQLQAAAAVGQMGVVQTYESSFQRHGRHTAQVLLTHEDLVDRQRYLNARSTLRSLMEMGVIAVVNENDTVATDEIRFGDNDTLAALVANLVEADMLVILTDQQGLFDKDPRHHADAELVSEGHAGDPGLLTMAGESRGALGSGGMQTKLLAAERAARSGTATVIASGREENILQRLRDAEQVGTFLAAAEEPLAARKQWLAGQLAVKGRLQLDDGAVSVLKSSGKSLLPVGVTAVEGDFRRGELVACVAPDGSEVARGLVNYNADETRQIMGQASDRISDILGYIDEAELVHRDDLVLV